MAIPDERELQILFEAAIIVHEFSIHWNQYNHIRTTEVKQFGKEIGNAFDNRQLNDSLVVRFLLNKLQSEHEAYVGVLEYLLMHLESGEFSEENFLKAIENARSGFHAQFHDSAANAANFMEVLTNRVSEYKDRKQPTPEQKYAIKGHMEIVNAGNSALRGMNSLRDRISERN